MQCVETIMADLVMLKDWLQQTPRKTGVVPAESAEILLFTGVRYERLDTPDQPPSKKTSGTARKRRG
jgi:hypothetical protein